MLVIWTSHGLTPAPLAMPCWKAGDTCCWFCTMYFACGEVNETLPGAFVAQGLGGGHVVVASRVVVASVTGTGFGAGATVAHGEAGAGFGAGAGATVAQGDALGVGVVVALGTGVVVALGTGVDVAGATVAHGPPPAFPPLVVFLLKGYINTVAWSVAAA